MDRKLTNTPNGRTREHLDLPEIHVWESPATPENTLAWVKFWEPHLRGRRRVLDVACGEGHLLEGLVRAGFQAEGVDLTPALVARARSKGLTVANEDAATFIRAHGERFDVFMLMDFVEHVTIETTIQILDAIPRDALVIIQTPNTNSLIGHQFYLQVPTHVVPLSPFVLGRLFERFHIRVLAEGTLYGGLPWNGLRRKLTEFLLVKLLGTVTTRLLAEGANYYVVGLKE